MVTGIVSDWHVRIQNCYVIKLLQKLLKEYQAPFPSQRVGSGNETMCGVENFRNMDNCKLYDVDKPPDLGCIHYSEVSVCVCVYVCVCVCVHAQCFC